MTNEGFSRRPRELMIVHEFGMSLLELSEACAVHADRITELVSEGVLEPAGRTREEWRFSALHLRHAGIAVRLQRDLGVNVAGAALALQLIEEIHTLRRRREARRHETS